MLEKILLIDYCPESFLYLAMSSQNLNILSTLSSRTNLSIEIAIAILKKGKVEIWPNLVKNLSIPFFIFNEIIEEMQKCQNMFFYSIHADFLEALLGRTLDIHTANKIAHILSKITTISRYDPTIVRHIDDIDLIKRAIYGKDIHRRNNAMNNPFLPRDLEIAGSLMGSNISLAFSL